jgi:hypothetical protein
MTQILQIILSGNNFNCTQEIYRLNSIAQEYTKESNSTHLKYGFVGDLYADKFRESYCTLIDDLVKVDINELTILLYDLQTRKMSKIEYETRLSTICNRITHERQTYHTDVLYPAAKAYIESEEKKYVKLISQ